MEISPKNAYVGMSNNLNVNAAVMEYLIGVPNIAISDITPNTDNIIKPQMIIGIQDEISYDIQDDLFVKNSLQNSNSMFIVGKKIN